MNTVIRLWNAQQAHKALTDAWGGMKAWLMAGHQLEVEVRPARRNDAQNRRLHAMLGDISKQIQWAGSLRDVDCWKRLCTAAWMRARGESVEILPAIDGHGIDVVFRHTSKLTKSECAELIDFIDAWGSQCGVKWTEQREEPQT
jgi:hypothetical protein